MKTNCLNMQHKIEDIYFSLCKWDLINKNDLCNII